MRQSPLRIGSHDGEGAVLLNAVAERARVLHAWVVAQGLRVRRWRFGDPPAYCVVCRRAVPGFRPYRGGEKSRSAATRVLEVVGSDLERHACPNCGCHDRERHLLLYLEKLGADALLTGADILHFAPEPAIIDLVCRSEAASYLQADLHPDRPAMACIDICAMPFPGASFDLVIANHVLEHVEDDRTALREVSRVLRPGGLALLQTPFSQLLSRTLEDPGLISPAARYELFGQVDHVRLYGRDFNQRAADAGLIARGCSHWELLSEIDPRRYGVNPREPLMLFRKAD